MIQIANPSVAALYEDALVYETGSAITSSGALSAYSGEKTGRSPSDKRIVEEDSSKNEIWWGPVNKPMKPDVSVTITLPFAQPSFWSFAEKWLVNSALDVIRARHIADATHVLARGARARLPRISSAARFKLPFGRSITCV